MNEGLTRVTPIRYTDDNCAQCWNCKKREGEKVLRWIKKIGTPSKYYALPVCCLDGGKAMFEVYHEKCPEYE